MRDTLQEGEKNQWKGVKKKKGGKPVGVPYPVHSRDGEEEYRTGGQAWPLPASFFFSSLSLSPYS